MTDCNLMDCYHFLSACHSCIVKGDIGTVGHLEGWWENHNFEGLLPLWYSYVEPFWAAAGFSHLEVLWGRHCVLQSFLLLWWRLRNSCACVMSPGVTYLGPWQTSKLTGQTKCRQGQRSNVWIIILLTLGNRVFLCYWGDYQISCFQS